MIDLSINGVFEPCNLLVGTIPHIKAEFQHTRKGKGDREGVDRSIL